MRFTLAGLILLGFCSLGFGQISGEVESIGFNNSYRPDCFTPMVIRIKPQGDDVGGLYQIQVKQKDIDGDDVTFSRWISVTAGNTAGNTAGSTAGSTGGDSAQDQRFSMYFLPTPTGLPDPSQGKTLRDLQKALKVFLYNQSGKQIATLPVTSSIMSIDPQGVPMDQHRGTHFILAVVGNGSAPSWDEYRNNDNLLGVKEDAVFVSISPRDLPENPIAYDAVDDVLWMNADPGEMKRGGDDKFRALETWIHRGGHLVICQSPEWQKYLDFGDLLPVTIERIDQKKDPEPLRLMVTAQMPDDIYYTEKNEQKVLHDPWKRLTGPFSIARAEAKPNTVIDDWVDWDAKGADRTPYIVRQAVGMGGVTWVAQDLGDPMLTSNAKLGWVFIWDKIFDWHNSPTFKAPYTPDSTIQSWARSGAVDLGPGLVGDALNQTGTVSTLIAVAVAFFIIYWLIAGPGLFAYLVTKRRQNLSWFGFALSAMVATAVTVLIVKLIVRGPPSLTHVSTISAAAGEPAIVKSNFGLYIKADGPERIELTGTDPGSVSTLTPLPISPDYMTESDDASAASSIDYEVPTREVSTTEPPVLTVYYRSTMKKFQARWIGNLSGRIEGSAKLVDAPKYIDGTITNGTGKKLENVYIAFKYPGEGYVGGDRVIWRQAWDSGVSIDLGKCFVDASGKQEMPVSTLLKNTPRYNGITHAVGRMRDWQEEYWNEQVRDKGSSVGDGMMNNLGDAFVMLSFFDRLQPLRADGDQARYELLRRGARRLDRSTAVAAGSMVVIAQAPGDLPVPLEVDGDKITGPGNVYYQFVLPIDRQTLADKAATQPTTEP